MANRYTRKLTPSLLNEDEFGSESKHLFELITGSARSHMPDTHGWVVDESQNEDGVEVEYFYGGFKGLIALRSGIDVNSIKGEGMVRSKFVLISLTCQDKRRVDAEQAEAEVVEGFEKTCSFIGAGLSLVLILIAQVSFIGVFSLRMTVLAVFVGFFFGGLVGYLMGDQISTLLGRKNRVVTFDDEVDLGVARADWSAFIDSMVEPIEVFSDATESVRSTATVL